MTMRRSLRLSPFAMHRITGAATALAMALAACGPAGAPAPGAGAGPAAPAAEAGDKGSVGLGAAGGESGALTASVAETFAALREQKLSAFDLALFRLDMVEAPKIRAALVENKVLKPREQQLGAYGVTETGEVRVRLDDRWQAESEVGRPFIVARIDFGSSDESPTPRAVEDAKQRAYAAVAVARAALTGSNGCEPWEIVPNGASRGKCTYHLIEQRFFPYSKSGYADPMDPARMHAVANIARAFRIESTAGFRAGRKETKRVTCTGPITADETKCEVRDIPPR